MVTNDNFVHAVTLKSACVPCIILYDDRQLADIRSFCFNKQISSVWSFDKTYNVGKLYENVSVYRNVVLECTASACLLTYIGPLFVWLQRLSNESVFPDSFSVLGPRPKRSPTRTNSRPNTPPPVTYQRSQININNRLPRRNGPRTNGSNCAESPPTGRSDFSTIRFHLLIGRI